MRLDALLFFVLVFGQERICQLAHRHKQGSDTKSLERAEKGNFFRPVWEAHLRAEGRVVRRGSSVGYVECEITDDRWPANCQGILDLHGPQR